MTEKIPPFDALIKLLGDKDEIARVAMVQLMQHYALELDEVLKQLQECDDPLLRKRSHQFQALLTFKKRREFLHRIMHKQNPHYFISDALIELHLTWFEKDSPAEIAMLYQDFLKKYPANHPASIETLSSFFRDMQLAGLPDSTACGDLYMIGAVLNNGYGGNAFMAALAMAVNEDLELGLDLQTIHFEDKFYLHDKKTNIVTDIRKVWDTKTVNFSEFKIFDNSQLLKYIGALCFCNAVHRDEFRYIQIIGEILAAHHDLSSLPYPYGQTGKNQK